MVLLWRLALLGELVSGLWGVSLLGWVGLDSRDLSSLASVDDGRISVLALFGGCSDLELRIRKTKRLA